MNPEQQRIVIAEICGWRLVDDNPDFYPYWEDPEGNMIAVGFASHRLPDYLADLNAIHEAEKTLSCNDKQKYLDILADAPREDIYYTWADSVFATAAQRAEAFLRAVGRWKE
jgi:hypothetical protein